MADVELERLVGLLRLGDVLALTGAGISTDSGIPDYRGPGRRGSRPRAPVTYQQFVGDADARRRYWARSHVGWGRVGQARPNAGHDALADLERRGHLRAVVTQNVDGLHRAAGSRRVVELHGSLAAVVCLGCGTRRPRLEFGLRLDAVNPGFRDRSARAAPDGDAEVPEQELRGFRTVSCRRCAGVLKPDVVFFGETIPPQRRATALALVRDAGALLVLGSSLAVMSGYRFVLEAVRAAVPIAIVNRGPTRGDRHADVRLDAGLSHVLPAVVARLAATAPRVDTGHAPPARGHRRGTLAHPTTPRPDRTGPGAYGERV